MEMPSVDNFVHDEERNVKFNIKAYRKLTPEEAITAMRFFYSQRKRKPKKNSQVIIMSLIGLRD